MGSDNRAKKHERDEKYSLSTCLCISIDPDIECCSFEEAPHRPRLFFASTNVMRVAIFLWVLQLSLLWHH